MPTKLKRLKKITGTAVALDCTNLTFTAGEQVHFNAGKHIGCLAKVINPNNGNGFVYVELALSGTRFLVNRTDLEKRS